MFGLDSAPLKLLQSSLSPCKPKRIKILQGVLPCPSDLVLLRYIIWDSECVEASWISHGRLKSLPELCQVLLRDDLHPLKMVNRDLAKFLSVPNSRSKTHVGFETTILDVHT